MREVSERTFKTYAREAVKELSKTELTATVKFNIDGVDIKLFRNNRAVGCVSIYTDGEIEAMDKTTGMEIEINPLHDTMKDVFKAIPEAVNAHLDENGFMFEEQEIDYNGYKPEQDYSEEDTKAGEEKEQAEKIVAELVLDRLETQLTELEELEEESDRADDEWDKDPLNLELEEASTKAYTREWNAYIKASQTLAAIIGMDTKTARQMLQRGSKNRQKVWELLNRRQKNIKGMF